MIDISVIIVNWNTREMVLDCIESIQQTTHTSTIEIIVVDNASTDASVEAIRGAFPQVIIIQNTENLGFAKANNLGIRKAKGRYISLVNSDVKAMEGVLDRMREFLDLHPEVGAIAPKSFYGNMQVQKNCREFPNLRNLCCDEFWLNKLFPQISFFRGRQLILFDYSTIKEMEVLSGCFLMVRREVIEKVGLLDERFFFYSEDVDWCKRIHDAGWKLVFYPEAKAIHYGGGSSSQESIRYQVEMLKSNWKYWKKHKNALECSLFCLIKLLGALIRFLGWSVMWVIDKGKKKKSGEKAIAYSKVIWWLLSMNRLDSQFLKNLVKK